MWDFKYDKEYRECTGGSAVHWGYAREDESYINESYVKWLESLVDENKIKEQVILAQKKKEEEKTKKKEAITTRVVIDI